MYHTRLLEALKRYEFNSWLQEFSAESEAAATQEVVYETVSTGQALDEWIERLEAADLFAFDTETTSLDAMQAELVGLSFCVEPGTAAYVPVGHDYSGAGPQLERDAVLARLRPLLEGAAILHTGSLSRSHSPAREASAPISTNIGTTDSPDTRCRDTRNSPNPSASSGRSRINSAGNCPPSSVSSACQTAEAVSSSRPGRTPGTSRAIPIGIEPSTRPAG